MHAQGVHFVRTESKCIFNVDKLSEINHYDLNFFIDFGHFIIKNTPMFKKKVS